MASYKSEWATLEFFFSRLDFDRHPESKATWTARALFLGITAVALGLSGYALTTPLLGSKPLPTLPNEELEEYRYRLAEPTRREIFGLIAVAELAERKRAIQQDTWAGHLWSREDDRGHYERVEFRRLAAQYKISLTQVYLVLDEGLRGHWPGPDGHPLPATTPPLNPRTTW